MDSQYEVSGHLEDGHCSNKPLERLTCQSDQTIIGSQEPCQEKHSTIAIRKNYFRFLPKEPLIPSIWSFFKHLIPRSCRKLSAQEPMGQTIVRKVQSYPKGFPMVSSFLDSDEAFMVYRRFGMIFSRLLLHKQDELRRMEEKLLRMDHDDAAQAEGGQSRFLLSCDFDERRVEFPRDWEESRTSLLKKMETKVIEYSDLLLRSRDIVALNRPSRRDYKSVVQFLENGGGPLYEEEASFIYEKEDLVTLRPGREHAWLDRAVERILQHMKWCPIVIWIFRSQETASKSDDQDIHYFTRDRISNCVCLVITAAVATLVIVPIWLLYRFSIHGELTNSSSPLAMILVFTLLFAAVLAAFTQARRHEVLAASAAQVTAS